MAEQIKKYGTYYTETRSKHALAVDRGINAKREYNTFNPKYKKAPNRSDVDEYDDINVKIETAPKPKPQEQPKPEPIKEQPPQPQQPRRLKDYVAEGSERNALQERFYQLPIKEQYLDLESTEKVAKTKEDIEKWKQNPFKNGDVRGIDTQPPALLKERIKFAREFSDIKKEDVYFDLQKGGAKRGQFAYSRFHSPESTNIRNAQLVRGGKIYKARGAGFIRVQRGMNKLTTARTIAHEVGHAFDRNIMGKGKQYDFGTGNAPFGNNRNVVKSFVFKNRPFERMKQGGGSEVIARSEEEAMKKFVTGKYLRYRNSGEELFADWFSTLLENRRKTRKQTKGFYGDFKSSNVGFFKGLRAVDKRVLKGFVRG